MTSLDGTGATTRNAPSAGETTRGPKFVGRSAEIAALEREFGRSAAGELRCMLVVGEAGVGKTRLASALVERRHGTTLALTARAYPLGETASFGLWVEALDRHFYELPAEQVRGLCGGFFDDLAVLLNSVALVRGSVPRREPPRVRLLEGLAVLIGNLASHAPVVLVLDDVHLADASSWEALSYVARHRARAPLLVVAAARPELREEPAAAQVVAELEQDGKLETLRLEPLGHDAVRELAEIVLRKAVVADALVEWLDEHARGNPLFAIDLLDALVQEGADLSSPRLERLPQRLRDRVGVRLQPLNEPQRATLELVAVLGQRVRLGDLVQHTRRPVERLAPILEELVRVRLVAEQERGPELTYEITHPLVQDAIYERIGAARRRALHRTVARALAKQGRLGAAAPHFARSAEAGDDEAIAGLQTAMRQAEERESYRESFAILHALLELIPSGDERWLGVLDAMTQRPEWVADHRADVDAFTGIRALREIDQLLERSPDLARRGMVLFRLATFLCWDAGEFEEAERLQRRAIKLLEQGGDAGTALLAATELGFLFIAAGDLTAGERQARAVVEAAEVARDSFAAMHALGLLGWTYAFMGNLPAAEAAFLRTNCLARDEGRLYRLTYGLVGLGATYVRAGRADEARAALAEARRVNPAGYWDTILLETEIHLEWCCGRFDEATTAARDTAARNPRGFSRRRAWAVAIAGMAAAELGRSSEAQKHLAAADVYDGRTFHSYSSCVPWAAGVIAWRQGRLTSALESLARGASILPSTDPALAIFALADLAEAAADAGDAAAAISAAERAREVVERLVGSMQHGLAELAAGWAALAARDRHRSATHGARAVELLADTPYAACHGRALELLGRSLAVDDRAGAVEALTEAVGVFESCGASLRRERVLGELRRLGSRGRRAEAAARGPGALTGREREVVRLAVVGFTAREIGERLFIGKRTVETHLASAYAKLGVPSKRELIKRASELGVAESVTRTEDTRTKER